MGRESAIVISVPEYAPLLDRWRVPTVPVASQGVPPHVTLLYPWRLAPVSAADIVAVSAAVSGVPPFSLTFGTLGRFPGVLYLRPGPDTELRALTQRLAEAFPDTPPYGGQHADPIPHLTVAQADSEEDLARIDEDVARELASHLPLVLDVDKVSVIEQGDSGVWSVRAVIGLRVGRHPQPIQHLDH
jgi:2'-5' RNA ligase